MLFKKYASILRSKLKEGIGNVLYFFDYVLISIFGTNLLKYVRIVHFSIDDVFEFAMGENEKLENSLKSFRDQFGIVVHLYIFYRSRNSILSGVPERLTTLDWIEWAPHQVEYIQESEWAIEKGKISGTIRIHGFSANQEQILELSRRGYQTFLTADSCYRVSYDLNKEYLSHLNKYGFVEVDGRRYLKTDIRLERLIFWQLLRRRNHKNPILVVFTHENKWCKVEKRSKLLLKLLKKQKVIFE